LWLIYGVLCVKLFFFVAWRFGELAGLNTSNIYISVGGGTLIQTIAVEAFSYAHFGVASSSPRRMVVE
jgi:hypothetical protein